MNLGTTSRLKPGIQTRAKGKGLYGVRGKKWSKIGGEMAGFIMLLLGRNIA
jgi:hypothetical protein